MTYLAADFAAVESLHKTVLQAKVANAVNCATWCFNEDVGATVLSLLPLELVSRRPDQPIRSFLRGIIAWFNGHFKVLRQDICSEEEGRDGARAESLMRLAFEGQGTRAQLTQMLAAVLECLLEELGSPPFGVR